MRERSLRISLAFCLLFLLPAAPALQALAVHRGAAESTIEAPANVFAGLLERVAAWLGWNEPQPTRLAVEDPAAGEPEPKPTDDNGTCLDPSGTPTPCKP
jgi:hypothetical protein